MRSKENIKELLDYVQSIQEEPLAVDEEAIAQAYSKSNDQQSLPIKVMSVFGGVLASLAFIGFLLVAGLYDSEVGLLIFGVLSLAGSIWLNKVSDRIIIDTFSVSAYLIGLTMISFGFDKMHIPDDAISLVFIMLALITLALVQSYILSLISVLVITGSFLFLIISHEGYEFIHGYVSSLAIIITLLFQKEAEIIFELKKYSKLYNPLRIGLVISFLIGLFFLGKRDVFPLSPNFIWVSSVVIIAAIVYWLPYLFRVLTIAQPQQRSLIYVLTVVLLLPTALSPAISGSMLLILLCFYVNHKTGLALSIVAFIYFVGQYYYDLNFTLLTKSIFLFLSGIFFLGLYWVVNKKRTANDEV